MVNVVISSNLNKNFPLSEKESKSGTLLSLGLWFLWIKMKN